MKDFDFEEFETEEDMELAFDDMVHSIAEDVKLEESEPAVIDPVRIYQLKFVHAVMKYLTNGTGAKVTYALHKPFRSMGNVSIEANDMTVCSSVWFVRAANLASNMEIYPLTNGKFRLTFTFHGITKNMG